MSPGPGPGPRRPRPAREDHARERRRRRGDARVPDGPVDPGIPGGPSDPGVPTTGPADAFADLDENLPLALFPVRLEARFLPDADPTEIVVRVFPDDIHADAHDPALTTTELVLAQGYWDWVWRVAAEPTGVAEARGWLADQLGPHRAVYVAGATRPATDPPAKPTPAGTPLSAPPKLAPAATRAAASPGVARLLPLHWAAFVEEGAETAGPFWATHPVASPLATTPALVELPEGAGARGFLDAQGLSWTYDLAAAEEAGMVIRIPLASLPQSEEGYDRLTVLGVAAGSDHGEALGDLLAAHRYTRGLDLLPPGTPTNVTEDVPGGAGSLDVGALFDAEMAPPPVGSGPLGPVTLSPRTPTGAAELLTAPPADAVAMAFGLAGPTAVDRAATAADPAPELARATNAALWPATWGKWFGELMAMVGDGSPLLEREQIDVLRRWFVDHVRADGPLPTLRVGRHPYGLLPVSVNEPLGGGSLFEELEGFLLDLWAGWFDADSLVTLDPDASDVAPTTEVAERASDVGAVYGATPHLQELRLRPVDDTYDELVGLYLERLAYTGLLCSLVPTDDGGLATPEELEDHRWYRVFLDHEDRARGGDGVAGQIDALTAMKDELYELSTSTGTQAQRDASLRAAVYISRFLAHVLPDGEEVVTGDLLGIVGRHHGRVEDTQPYLADLGIRDELGTGLAPRLYTGAYGEDGTELPVGVLVAAGDDVAALSGWLEGLRRDVEVWQAGGDRRVYDHTVPVPLLQQVLQSAVASAARGEPSAGLEQGLARLRDLVDTDGVAAIATLERLLRGTLGLAVYRVDAWMTAFASERLGVERSKRPTGLQVGGYGWLVDLAPRAGPPSQGHIHAPSLDHATTAAVLRSGWSAFGTAGAGSPLAVDLSSERVRAARAIVEGVRAGQELGRLLGGRFERRLHDRHLDRHVDEVRAAVLAGAGEGERPPTRVVDGLLLARAYTEGIEQTGAERDVRDALDPVVTPLPGVRAAVDETVADLDAVSDVLMAQAVHSLLRGDAGVAAPTLAATGSGDSGLPAIDLPETNRGGRLVTVRVTGLLDAAVASSPPVWPSAASSVLAAAEPRLERWVGQLLGPPANVVIEVRSGGALRRVDLTVLGVGALDVVYGIDRLGEDLLAALAAGDDALIVGGRPSGLADDQLGWDELVTFARSLRTLLGRVRALSTTDLATGLGGDLAGDLGGDLAGDPVAGAETRDLADLQARLAAATALVPAGDPRHVALAEHRAANPVDTVDVLIEQLHVVTVELVPILPLLSAGVPSAVAASFTARGPAPAGAAWLAQAAKVRPDLERFLDVAQLAELVAGRPLLSFALAQSPDGGGPWAGTGEPTGPGPHVAWCNVTGVPDPGPVAGFVVDAWTETIPARRTTSGIAVHFDRPSATAPNVVLLAVTRGQQQFNLDLVHHIVRRTLLMAQFRAAGSDDPHVFAGQFLPAVFLPGDAAILADDDTEGAA